MSNSSRNCRSMDNRNQETINRILDVIDHRLTPSQLLSIVVHPENLSVDQKADLLYIISIALESNVDIETFEKLFTKEQIKLYHCQIYNKEVVDFDPEKRLLTLTLFQSRKESVEKKIKELNSGISPIIYYM